MAITSSFEEKIAKLNEAIKEAQHEYMKAYRIAEERQNEKFGHKSTPAYEKEINKLDLIKQNKISNLQNKIDQIKSEMQKNDDYQLITNNIKVQEDKIKMSENNIVVSHKSVLDSRQELLNVENDNFKRLKTQLTSSEQKTLELKRDSIRVNPCK
jgi:hypothetical protein